MTGPRLVATRPVSGWGGRTTWLPPDGAIDIGSGTKWALLYQVGQPNPDYWGPRLDLPPERRAIDPAHPEAFLRTVADTVTQYARHIAPWLPVWELTGRDLACRCLAVPNYAGPCHGTVLLALANRGIQLPYWRPHRTGGIPTITVLADQIADQPQPADHQEPTMLVHARSTADLTPTARAHLTERLHALAVQLPEWTALDDPHFGLARPGDRGQVAAWPQDPGADQIALVAAGAACPPVLWHRSSDAAEAAASLRRALVPDLGDADRDRCARLGRAATLTLAFPGTEVNETSETHTHLTVAVGDSGWIRCYLCGSGLEASGEFRFLPVDDLARLTGAAPRGEEAT